MPLASVTGIDHAVVLVRDLAASREKFARLGFTISPMGRHSAHMGTVNHTIMLRDDYLELLAVETPTPSNQRWRDRLARREGLDTIALRTSGAERTAEELKALGFADATALHFSRPVAPGKDAAFNVCLFPPAASPQLNLFVCEHLTRDAVWLPELMEHPNTAVGLAAVTVVVESLSGLPQAYGRLFGTNRVLRNGPEVVVETGSAPIRFVTRPTLEQLYPGIELASDAPPYVAALGFRVLDLAAAEATLAAASPARIGASLCIAPREACGVLLEFTG